MKTVPTPSQVSAPQSKQAGRGAAGRASSSIDSCLLSLPVQDPPHSPPKAPPLPVLSDLRGARAGLRGPAGPEGETAETPGTGSGREGLFPLAEQGCGESRPYLPPVAVGPGRQGGAESEPFFPSLSRYKENGGSRPTGLEGSSLRGGHLYKERNSERRADWSAKRKGWSRTGGYGSRRPTLAAGQVSLL